MNRERPISAPITNSSPEEQSTWYQGPPWREVFGSDLRGGLVVFLVSLPLCLGIAFASGAPPISGLLAGIIGGLVIGPLSRSALSVSGPAAGLIVIVLGAISDLGSFEAFLTALVVAGVLQVALGFLRAGVVAYFFPLAVIKGMLSGIGVVLILKQLPHAFGYDGDFEGDFFFFQNDGRNTLTEIPHALDHLHLGATITALVGLALLIWWPRQNRIQWLKQIPAAVVVVVLGISLKLLFDTLGDNFAIRAEHLVQVPDFATLLQNIRSPDWSALGNAATYKVAAVIAVVASVETLLCIEAIDKLDPYNRTTPTSRELKAQGVGNLVAGLVGALPITSVIIRSSTNLQAGGRTRTATIVHGALLAVSVLAIPNALSMIPLAALAAVLLHVGYNLAPVHLFKKMYRQGPRQFVPYAATCAGVVFTDLLTGVMVGMVISVVFLLHAHVSAPFGVRSRKLLPNTEGKEHIRVELADNISFLNKASISSMLHNLPSGSLIELDASRTRHIDHDALEVIDDFARAAPLRKVGLVLVGFDELRKRLYPASENPEASSPGTNDLRESTPSQGSSVASS